jgi:myo-inositol-1(or 4)-monophosphatase
MEPIAGVIYAPLLQELFWAEKGSGAWFEELGDSGGLRKRLRISTRSDFSESFLCLGSLRELTRSGLDKAIAPLLEKFHGVRSYGSSALSLAYVAAGNFDIFVQQILSPWDIAAALLLIREAGGYATDFAGRNHTLAEKSIVAGNEKLQLAIVQELKKNHIS